MKVVAGNSNPPLAQAISAQLNLPITRASISRFADMEIWVEIHENVRGFDVRILEELLGDMYDITAEDVSPQDLGFSFVARPRIYSVLTLRGRIASRGQLTLRGHSILLIKRSDFKSEIFSLRGSSLISKKNI